MEETHQKKIEDLQRQHQRELEKLREEKDRLLAEETAATISGRPKGRECRRRGDAFFLQLCVGSPQRITGCLTTVQSYDGPPQNYI